MHDAGRRRHDAEVVERLLAPLQELVALAVALELALGVIEEGECRTELIHLHGVVDDQVHRDQRVDALGIAAQPCHGRTHRRQIHHAGHAGEVLHHDPCGLERQLDGDRIGRIPVRQPNHVLLGHGKAVDLAQQSLQQHLDRERQPGDLAYASLFESGEAVIDNRLARAGKAGSGVEGIGSHLGHEAHSWQRISQQDNRSTSNDTLRL